MDEQNEVIKQFRQQQEKFTYYIVGLSVAAIGFSIIKTNGLPLSWTQIPLGLAVLSWAISIYCGLTFLKYVISNLYANKAYFDIVSGQDPKVGNHPELIKAAVSGITQAMQSNSDKAEKLAKWQDRLFYCGIVFFLVWHVLEMYLKTTR